MLKKRRDPPNEWAELGADVLLTLVAYGLDAIALALIRRRKDPKKKRR